MDAGLETAGGQKPWLMENNTLAFRLSMRLEVALGTVPAETIVEVKADRVAGEELQQG